MNYIFKGNLCTYLCSDCSETLSFVKVRLYLPDNRLNVALHAVASASDTFHQVTNAELEAKNALFLAETVTDAQGNFVINLSDEQGYKGGAFDLDFVCGTGYGKPKPPKKLVDFQFHITTIQPQWREKQIGKQELAYYYGWEYCLSTKYWCAILQLLDRWVICGTVVDCETKKPAVGVKVLAFDVDLIQDDPLGFAYTDNTGHFKLIYTSDDFSKTIFSWLNTEWPAGPDIYFRVESSSGLVLLQEDRNVGHSSTRENRPNCTCVKLCVTGVVDTDTPWFTHIGEYNIVSDIDATGHTSQNRTFALGIGIGFGFFGNVKLSGFATKKTPTDLTKPLWYRFLFSKDNGVTWQPITETQLTQAGLKVGERQITWNGMVGFQNIYIDPTRPASVPDVLPADNYPTPIADHILRLDANGWVRVDQSSFDNGFHGPLMWVNTNTIVSGGNATDASDTAGANPAVPKNGQLVQFKFQTTDDPTNLASPNFNAQVLTAKAYINNWEEVRLLHLDELVAGPVKGCTPITTHANVHTTTDHELMAEWALTAASAAIPTPSGITIVGANGSTPRGGIRNFDFAVPAPLTVTPPFSLWPSCSYQLYLTTRRKLTNGEGNDDATNTAVFFCK